MVELSLRHSQGCAAACWIVTPRSFRPTHFRGEEGLTPSPLGSTGEVISSYIRQRAAQSVDFDWWWFQCLVLERVEVKVGGEIVVASRAAQAVVFWTLPTGGLGVTWRQPPGLFWGVGGFQRGAAEPRFLSAAGGLSHSRPSREFRNSRNLEVETKSMTAVCRMQMGCGDGDLGIRSS